MQRHLAFDRVAQLKDQVTSLVAQLGHGRSKRAKERGPDGATIAKMQAEHHRLGVVTDALDAAFSDACTAEELALEALFAGAPVEVFLKEGLEARERFRSALVRALVAAETQRDEATFLLQEIGGTRALDLWLAPLLEAMPARSWQATVHVHGDRGVEGWPEDRPWGPPRSVDWALAAIAREDRTGAAWLLCVRGPSAGVLLSLEAGLHRIAVSARSDDPPALLAVTLLARKVTFSDVEWSDRALQPTPPPNVQDVKPGLLARDYDGRQEVLTLFSRRGAIPLVYADYWPRFDAIALEHLLVFEEGGVDRETALAPRLRDWDDVRALIRQGRTIEAIKLYRQRTGLGLREAKDAVEGMRGDEP
jgi:hypothetical protein